MESHKLKIEDVIAVADLTAQVLLKLESATADGVHLHYLDALAESMIREAGAEPYNKGYHPSWAKLPYPATICASINEEICHAPPGNRVLKEGDIVSYDLGIKLKGACGDAALTVPVGLVDSRKMRLIRYTKQCLRVGITQCIAGNTVGHISQAIQQCATLNGYQIIKEYGGHGIGEEMHMDPLIPNWIPSRQQMTADDKKIYDRVLEEGDVLCIEPMITPGSGRIGIVGEDKWTVFALDGQPSAQFEAMVLVEKDQGVMLTDHIKF